MNEQTKMQKVIDVMKEKGSTDEQVSEFLTELTKSAFARIYTVGMASFNEEDMQAIEACSDQNAANEMIKKLYNLRTGRSATEETQKFLDDFATGFLAEYEREKAQVA
ncbi:MAG: hypothetical protein ACD_20C00144G0003 [uncultured bacterium]|nr:MAG: hypothetical protein ACD_20C00144G0003 [uncultured bacterium]OGE62738.1 MAG: hypothetical protein A2964_00450 [Candidatus Daviesbacteria bacterium RIFCSPLOWO2_01_FULL_40_27]